MHGKKLRAKPVCVILLPAKSLNSKQKVNTHGRKPFFVDSGLERKQEIIIDSLGRSQI